MAENHKEKKRIPELDIMRGIGIILIAVFHIVFRSMNGIPDKVICSLGWGFVSTFFVLSGYTCRIHADVLDSYKRRIVGLILPVLVIELVLLTLGGLYCMAVHGYTFRDVIHDVIITFLRPEVTTRINGTWGGGGILFTNLSPVWFVWSMVWTELFFHPLKRLIFGKKERVWVCFVIALFLIQNPMYVLLKPAPWGLTILPTYLLFMMIGLKLRERNAEEYLNRLSVPVAVAVTVLGLLFHFGLFLFNGNESYYRSEYGNRGLLDVYTVVLQVLVFVPAMYLLARAVKGIPLLSKGLQWMGRHSLMVLLTHCIIAVVYCDILHNYIRPGAYWYPELKGISLTGEIVGKSIITCILSLITCIPLCMLWDRVSVIRFKRSKKSHSPGD